MPGKRAQGKKRTSQRAVPQDDQRGGRSDRFERYGAQGWLAQSRSLADNHGWKCKPGYKVFIMGRGAVRFDFPGHWIIVLPTAPEEISVKLHDLPPPKDNCRLEVSYLPLNPEIDFSGLPVTELLRVAMEGGRRDVLWRSETHTDKRPDGIEYAWREIAFYDTNEKREARSRIFMARGNAVQPLITLDYWPEHEGWFLPVWDEVIRTLQLGQYVKDATKRILN